MADYSPFEYLMSQGFANYVANDVNVHVPALKKKKYAVSKTKLTEIQKLGLGSDPKQAKSGLYEISLTGNEYHQLCKMGVFPWPELKFQAKPQLHPEFVLDKTAFKKQLFGAMYGKSPNWAVVAKHHLIGLLHMSVEDSRVLNLVKERIGCWQGSLEASTPLELLENDSLQEVRSLFEGVTDLKQGVLMKVEVEYHDLERLLKFVPQYAQCQSDVQASFIAICASIHMAREHEKMEKEQAKEKQKEANAGVFTYDWYHGLETGEAHVPMHWKCLPNGDKVTAIKLVRLITGLGLKEAKDVVDQALSFSATPAQISKAIQPNVYMAHMPTFQMV